jgi:hypothetical protein
MNGGTPQGSLTGVLMFIVYLDELSRLGDKHEMVEILNFINDTYIYQKLKENEVQEDLSGTRICAVQPLNEVIKDFVDTATSKEMQINASKTELLIFRPPKVQKNYKANVVVGNQNLSEPQRGIRILGCEISDQLSIDGHIEKLLKKGRTRLNLLRTLKTRGARKVDMTNVYKAMIKPVVSFGLTIFGPMMKRDHIIRLERFQKLALRIIYGYQPYRSLLVQAKISSLEDHIIKLFQNFANSLDNSRSLGKRLVKREGGRELRKHPGLAAPKCNTILAKSTPINIIRTSNSLNTPGNLKININLLKNSRD